MPTALADYDPMVEIDSSEDEDKGIYHKDGKTIKKGNELDDMINHLRRRKVLDVELRKKK